MVSDERNVFAELNDETARSNERLMDEVADLRRENARLKRKAEEVWQRNKWHYTKDRDFPTVPGSYLVWRDWNGVQYPQILCYDGKFWVTGNDHQDNMIVAWKEVEPPEKV